jgi:hypothetical protein
MFAFEAWEMCLELMASGRKVKFEVTPYPKEGKDFDSRIGWYTQIVLSNIYGYDQMTPMGFLSEPF